MSTTQNEYTNALLSYSRIVADNSANSKEATLTVEAEIVKVVDEGLGTYTVKYLGNTFAATTAHNQITYKKGDKVFVLIPNGNFDNNKIILSPVAPSAGGYIASSMSSSGSTYINISDNLFKSVSDISLSSWKTVEASSSRSLTDNTGFSSLFQGALRDSRLFNFTCKIMTEIEEDRRSRGNYGLELHIPVLQKVNGTNIQTDYSVKLDINNIVGDPYNLQVPTLQNIYFTLPEDMSLYVDNYNIPWIGYFVGEFLGQDDTKPDDIFITDIQLLSALEVNEETTPGYYSVINATEGNSFLASRTGDTKTLTVTTYLNGKITRNDDFSCYWFKENMSINPSSDKFHNFGGRGWEILNSVKSTNYTEDGKPVYEYITNDYTQKIFQSDIHVDTKFKCVLMKDLGTENVAKIESFVVIKNLENNAILELSTDSGSTVYSQGIGNVILQLKYYEEGITNLIQSEFSVNYSWMRKDKNGNFIDDFDFTVIEFNKQITEKGKKIYLTKISYPVSKIDELNTFYCTASVSKNDRHLVTTQIIGTAALSISIGQFLNGHIEITNGNKIYKYDADGNSPMSDGQYSGPLSSFITTIDPIQIKVYKGDGNEFTSDEYTVTDVSWLVPVNSMIVLTTAQKTDPDSNPGYYTISGKYNVNSQLTYKISNTYSPKKNDNTIIIKVSAPSSILENTLTTITNISFLKDGEGGTNGTEYSGVINYNGYSYGQGGHKLQLIYVANAPDNKKWYLYDPGVIPINFSPFVDNNVRLTTTLYKGDPLSDPYQTKWSIFDTGHNKDTTYVSATSPISIDNNGYLTLNGNNMTSSDDTFCTIIQAEINCNSSASPLYVYAYYPIECAYVSKLEYLNYFLPILEGGFSKVLYASDGSNPSYDDSSLFKINNSLYKDISDYFYCQWKNSPNIIISSYGSVSTKTEIKGTPISKFNNGLSNNYIKALLRVDQTNINKITTKINTLNVDKTNITGKRFYYQSLQNNLSVFTDFNNSYNTYKNLLLNSKTVSFYSAKNSLVEVTKNLLENARQILSICYDYRKKDDGSDDIQVNNVYDNVNDKINILENLNNLCFLLGVEDVIDDIKAIIPSSLIIDGISFSGIPERTCYYSINSSIEEYNYSIIMYDNYLADLNNQTILEGNEIAQEIINWLVYFVEDPRLDNLTKTYSGYNEECYRYTGLIKVLEGYVAIASEQTSNYNSMIENVITPIFDNVAWYISFTNNGGYSSIISELNSQLSSLTSEINILTGISNIASEMKTYGISTISYCKPILFTYNRYQMSFLNDWDGNKLSIDDNGSYIIAPQVGAGSKDSANRFTGIVLGVSQVKERDANSKIGLFGFSHGNQSIFLNAENGSATFGETGSSQIIIQPGTDAVIKSGNFNAKGEYIYIKVEPQPTYPANPAELGYYENVYSPSQSKYIYQETTDQTPKSNKSYYIKTNANGGMQINFSKPEIIFGTGNFKVDEYGEITAKGGGKIAGWEINDTQIFKNKLYIDSGTTKTTTNDQGQEIEYKSYGFYSNNHDTIDSTSKGFYLGPDGLSIANSSRSRIELSINGDPKIYSGGHNALTSENPVRGFYLGNDGLSIGSKVYIDNDGVMRLGKGAVANTGKHWVIDGDSGSDSSISYVKIETIEGRQKVTESVYIGTNQIRIGEPDNNGNYPFYVTNKGKLYAKNAEIEGKITASEGSIGGWKIVDNTLMSINGAIKLHSDGYKDGKFIEGPNAYFDLEGGGDFSGCHINASKVIFSTSGIAVTQNRGDLLVSPATDGDVTFVSDISTDGEGRVTGVTKTTAHFIHGLLVSQ